MDAIGVEHVTAGWVGLWKVFFLEFLDFKGKVLFFYTTLLHRLRHSKPWSKTRRLWGNAWWEMHHSFLGAKLLVSIKSCNNF